MSELSESTLTGLGLNPSFVRLPWQRKLVRFEIYVDALIASDRKDNTQAMGGVRDELAWFVRHPSADKTQLNAALLFFARRPGQPRLWREALNVHEAVAPTHGVGDHYNTHDAMVLLNKLKNAMA